MRFSNGVIGKVVVYNMEERQRVKIVDYVGTEKVDQSKIDEKLKEKQLQIRLDSFIDPGLIRRVAGVVREVYAEKGYQFAEVKPEIKEVEGGPKLVNVTFHITEGPKVQIREVDFVGNKAIKDSTLATADEGEQGRGLLLVHPRSGGTYKEEKFEEDAAERRSTTTATAATSRAQVGQPELKIARGLEGPARRAGSSCRCRSPRASSTRSASSSSRATRSSRPKALRPLFKIEAGRDLQREEDPEGHREGQEVYGAGGYYEFTAYPDLKPRDQPLRIAMRGMAANGTRSAADRQAAGPRPRAGAGSARCRPSGDVGRTEPPSRSPASPARLTRRSST